MIASYKVLWIFCLLASAAFAPRQMEAAPSSEEFEDFLERCWQEDLKEHPEFAVSLGHKEYAPYWTDASKEAIDKRRAQVKARRSELAEIDPAELEEQERISYEILKQNWDIDISGFAFGSEFLRVSQQHGIQTSMPSHISRLPQDTVDDYKSLQEKLDGIPKVIQDNQALLQEGLAKGIMPYRSAMAGVPAQLDYLTRAFADNPLSLPYRQKPQAISQGDWQKIASLAQKTFEQKVIPAFKAFREFMVKNYIPKGRKDPGLSSLPQGQRWYQHRILANTTLDRTAQSIHKTGLEEVARIKAAMLKEIKAAGFKGSFKAFTKGLTQDKKHFYKNKQDLLDGYKVIAKTIDPGLVKLFHQLPRLPYGIEAVPDYRAEAAPTAYYQHGSLKAGLPGIFYANTFDLKARPRWSMAALTLHEAVPGHHFQIALAQELDGLPKFRQHMSHTAFVEGWALYAESLGYDLGLYQDPYSRFGQLSYEMWRAIRLVVDTGIHALGWSRQQAIDYFRENSALTEKNITVEVDRYIAWPGQALAYKMGQLTIQRLKEEAQAHLQNKFDIRAFHTSVLENGSIPLKLLEKNVKEAMRRSHDT